MTIATLSPQTVSDAILAHGNDFDHPAIAHAIHAFTASHLGADSSPDAMGAAFRHIADLLLLARPDWTPPPSPVSQKLDALRQHLDANLASALVSDATTQAVEAIRHEISNRPRPSGPLIEIKKVLAREATQALADLGCKDSSSYRKVLIDHLSGSIDYDSSNGFRKKSPTP